jgi:hypothetical protein
MVFTQLRRKTLRLSCDLGRIFPLPPFVQILKKHGGAGPQV